MSLKHIQRIFDLSQTRGGTRMALVVVADKADDLGYCWPGQELIAKQAGLTTRSIGRNLQEAADLGELIILARTGAKNRYVVSLGAEEKEIFKALTERASISRTEAAVILEAWKSIKSEDILSGVDEKSEDILSGVERVNPRQDVVSPPTSCRMTPDKMSSDPSITIKNQDDDDQREREEEILKVDQPQPQPAILEKSQPAPPPPPPAPFLVLDAPQTDWVIRLHQAVFQTVGLLDADVIRTFSAKYPRAWIEEAYRRARTETAKPGKRIMAPGSYLDSILAGMYETGLTGQGATHEPRNQPTRHAGLATDGPQPGRYPGRYPGANGNPPANQSALGEPYIFADDAERIEFEEQFKDWQL